MDPILRVEDLGVSFGKQPVLEGLSFDVLKGDVLAIVGPNGAGKTVLFRTLLATLPHSGKIKWSKQIQIGYVPQKVSIERSFPVSVGEFLRMKGASEAEVWESLQAVGISHRDEQGSHHTSHFLTSRLGEISGGELQRVLIAYALINHPDVLLFDEPTAGIDIGGEETIYSLLEKLHKEHKLTILLITHDLGVIYRYANKVLCLNHGNARFGTPKETMTEKTLEELYGAKVNLYHHHNEH